MSLEPDRSRDGATEFAELNQLLVELVDGVREVLGDTFCGAYLQGSFAVGDADAHSDVDFIVVTNDDVTPEQQAELQVLHQKLFTLPTPWAQHLEGSLHLAEGSPATRPGAPPSPLSR
jgi:predicted nucleotidyltransferase